ncbi:MAG: hypothetical protein Q8Q58_11285 [Candidatus Rokubacteria bacterium]|nr:hypothetical protein [Candidatus Rokubacteria bacterium]
MILRDDRNDIAVLTLAHGKVRTLDLDLLRALDTGRTWGAAPAREAIQRYVERMLGTRR